jgi:type I restriction-modification system DNA methylase subunit
MVKVYRLLIYPTGTKLANLDKKKEKQELSSKPVNYTLSNQKITFEFLKAHLWAAADILRGSLDPTGYRQPVMTLLFLKRLNDTFEENEENEENNKLKLI